MKRIVIIIAIGLGIAALSAAQTQQSAESNPFRQEGIASWYGPEFDGRPTASGEIFNSTLFTAAHPSLPFGTKLRITNKHNNKQVLVRVNDRGPFVSARIIDLSKAAAEQLDMIITGTAPVIVEGTDNPVIAAESAPGELAGESGIIPSNRAAELPGQPGTIVNAPVDTMAYISAAPAINPEITPNPVNPSPFTIPAAPPAAIQPALQSVPIPAYSSLPAEIKGGIPPAGTGKSYRLQVGAYKIPRNAVEAFERLRQGGLNPAYERNGEFYRVVLAGIRPEEVALIAEKLGAAGFREAIIREEF
jgi:rare lipoprotein A